MTTILLIIRIWAIQAGFAAVQGDPAVVEESRRLVREPLPYAALTMEKAKQVCTMSKREYHAMPSVIVECNFYEIQMRDKTQAHPSTVRIHKIGMDE